MVNLATNFSTKGPVWRPQFCARFRVRTNGAVWRPENERQVSENEIQNFKNLSHYSRNVNLAHSHTPARPIPPPPPPISNTVVPFLFLDSFLKTTINHENCSAPTVELPVSSFSGEDKIEESIFILRLSNKQCCSRARDRRNGESVHFRFRA